MNSADLGGGKIRVHSSQDDDFSKDEEGWLAGQRPAVLCFSHLRWDFVYQRPQHLMSRFARAHSVYYFEEPLHTATGEPYLERRQSVDGVCIMVPRLPPCADAEKNIAIQRELLDRFLADEQIRRYIAWYYTPMSLQFSAHLDPDLTIYDCMDELSAFRGAPPTLGALEQALLARTDAVFTGGYSLYEAKREVHPNAHPFPSSVDATHFRRAREAAEEPSDQRGIAHPRLGFYGVIDERFDIDLIAGVAAARPEWQIVLVGPVVKIDRATLPQAANIHYLGAKNYAELPAYLAGWDVALMPFARNESTRFISPTKTPEYLAGGKPVVSTPIVDVVRTYSHTDLVRIAEDWPAFIRAIEAALVDARNPKLVAQKADTLLGQTSWDGTWADMREIMERAKRSRATAPAAQSPAGRYTEVARNPRLPVSTQRPVAARYDYLVVGAGFAGSVLAERLAAGLGKRVLVIDKRPHIGGNAYDHYNEAGLLVHRYGPHIFHTNSEKVMEYLSRFTRWRPYEHRVLARVDDMLVPMPINLKTLSMLSGRDLNSEQAEALLASRAVPVANPKTSEDVVISKVGRELYEKFFRGYTRKQWGLDPSQLDRSVTSRVPTRTTMDDRYFSDTHQCMPLHGYTAMFEKMLDHPNIHVLVNTDFKELDKESLYGQLIYTGPIDQYFDYRHGALPYRSLRFEHETLAVEYFQPVAVVNYPSEDVPYTRVTEYKYLTGQTHRQTSITYEFPCADGDPYYPVPRPENAELFRKYQALADASPDVHFVGRLATYKYYNMDQVVAQALAVYSRIEETEMQGASISVNSLEA